MSQFSLFLQRQPHWTAFERLLCLTARDISDIWSWYLECFVVGLGETDVLRSCALRDMDTQGPLAGAGFSIVTIEDILSQEPRMQT